MHRRDAIFAGCLDLGLGDLTCLAADGAAVVVAGADGAAARSDDDEDAVGALDLAGVAGESIAAAGLADREG
ncbi:hypothetical protein EKO27_g11935, partial [Xylaria grammica]